MGNNKALSFTMGIVAIILGVVLFKHFDFATFKFQKPALDIVYLITFIFAIYLLIRNAGNKSTV